MPMPETVLLIIETQNGDHFTIEKWVWLLLQSSIRKAFRPLKSWLSAMSNNRNVFLGYFLKKVPTCLKSTET